MPPTLHTTDLLFSFAACAFPSIPPACRHLPSTPARTTYLTLYFLPFLRFLPRPVHAMPARRLHTFYCLPLFPPAACLLSGRAADAVWAMTNLNAASLIPLRSTSPPIPPIRACLVTTSTHPTCSPTSRCCARARVLLPSSPRHFRAPDAFCATGSLLCAFAALLTAMPLPPTLRTFWIAPAIPRLLLLLCCQPAAAVAAFLSPHATACTGLVYHNLPPETFLAAHALVLSLRVQHLPHLPGAAFRLPPCTTPMLTTTSLPTPTSWTATLDGIFWAWFCYACYISGSWLPLPAVRASPPSPLSRGAYFLLRTTACLPVRTTLDPACSLLLQHTWFNKQVPFGGAGQDTTHYACPS